MIEKRIAAVLERERLSDTFVPEAEQDGIFYCNDGHFGACMLGYPMVGGDDGTRRRLKGAVSMDMPANSFISVMYFSNPHIENDVNSYKNARLNNDMRMDISTGLRAAHRRHSEMFEHAAKNSESLFAPGLAIPNDVILLVSIKVPMEVDIRSPDYPEHRDKFDALVTKFKEANLTAGLYLESLDEPQYLKWMRMLYEPFAPVDRHYNEDIETRAQILGPTSEVVEQDGYLVVNKKSYIKMMGVKRTPKKFSLFHMDYLVGDPGGLTSQFGVPFFICTTIFYPDVSDEKSSINNKSKTANYQATGPLAKMLPRLVMKKQGIDIMMQGMDRGDRPVRMSMTVGLYGQDKKKINQAVGMVEGHFNGLNVLMGEEQRIYHATFWNSLPLMCSKTSIDNTNRFWSMTIDQALQFLPVWGDWRGTRRTAVHLFSTRRGQTLSLDLWDAPGNRNVLLAGESGMGKGVLTQQLVLDLLSIGTQVRVMDIGYTYYKLCHVLGGEYLDFREGMDLCFNPFSLIKEGELNESMEELKILLVSMMQQNNAPLNINSEQWMLLGEAITACFENEGPSMTPTTIQQYLYEQNDTAGLKTMGRLMHDYTINGIYGEWFNGENNIDFNNDFVVLELQQLSARPQLQKVIMQVLTQRIQREVFKGDRGRRRFILMDEAAQFIKSEEDRIIGDFFQALYRRARKEGAGAMLVFQSLQDVAKTSFGQGIMDNAAWKIIMGQQSGSVRALQKSEKLSGDPYLFDLMESISTVRGRYSEMLIMGPPQFGYGVGRFVAPKFNQVLFSSSDAARDDLIAQIRKGVDAEEAIESFIARGGRA